MKIDRNAPCPCGSGLKFKKCHLGKEHELGPEYAPRRASSGAQSGSSPAIGGPNIMAVVYPAIGLIFVGVLIGIALGQLQWAVAGGGVALLGLVAYVVLRDPPPPKDDSGNPSGLNFGN